MVVAVKNGTGNQEIYTNSELAIWRDPRARLNVNSYASNHVAGQRMDRTSRDRLVVVTVVEEHRAKVAN